MTEPDHRGAGAPGGFFHGVRLSIPVMIPLALFGSAFGTVAAQKGLTLAEAVSMTAIVFAGASQFVAVEMWTHPLSASAIATIVLVTATVNMRFVLMSASLRPWLAGAPAWQTYSGLLLMTDPGWLIALRYSAEGGKDAAVFLGVGAAQWLIWVAAAAPGYVLGTLVAEPARFGLDLIMPTFFAAMLVPLWRGAKATRLGRAVPWAVAGVVALIVAELVEGWWFIVAGALAGSIAAGLRGDDG